MDPAPPPAPARLAAALESISEVGDPRGAYRRLLISLARRAKLLAPLADELADRLTPLTAASAAAVLKLAEALEEVLQVLKIACEMSRIALVILQGDAFRQRFQDAVAWLDECLAGMPYDELEVSDEVREQVDLVHAQLKRTRELIQTPDDELCSDMISAYNNSYESEVDMVVLERLSEKLQLTTISDLMCESLALHDMVASSGGTDPGEQVEKMSTLLKKIKDYVQTKNPEMGSLQVPRLHVSTEQQKPIAVPEEFRCPISLEIMKDPVIVSTGQTYERECIMRWLESGHKTCPTTRQKLSDKKLTPNYVLRSLIAQWCEANGVAPPERSSHHANLPSSGLSGERSNIAALVSRLRSPDQAEQLAAAGELRLLAKRNSENRVFIAEAGAIPLLGNLLFSSDVRIQEHAVTALLNLSIHEDNKESIMLSGALTGIINVLRNGNTAAQENAAATLFSLSLVHEYKVTIGATGAIPLLISLLRDGSPRGKKDAATALFNLCIFQGNKGRAIHAGIVPLVFGYLTTTSGAMIDESLALLSIISSHPEGKAAALSMDCLPVLVERIATGTPRNKENATAVVLNLCSGQQQLENLAQAKQCGIVEPLQELSANGTERGKRKAAQLLELMSRLLADRQEEGLMQEEAPPQVPPSEPRSVDDWSSNPGPGATEQQGFF